MVDDHLPDDTTFDSEALEEWVNRTAENKGVSRGELLDRMLSSYWILEELAGMMDSGEGSGPGPQPGDLVAGQRDSSPSGDRAGSEQASDSTDGELSELIQEFQSLRTAIEDMSERQRGEHEPQRAGQSTRPERDERVEPRDRRVTDAASQADLEELRDRVETVLEELEAQRDQLETVSALVEDQQERHEADIDRVSGEVTEVIGHLEHLQEEVAAAVHTDEFMEFSESVGAEISDVREAQSAFEDRLDREFDSIEQVFQHLLDKADELEYRIGAVGEAYQRDLEPLKEFHSETERLAELKAEAIQEGEKKGVCGNCGTDVDLSLLSEPYCPSCDRAFSGIRGGGWVPFRSARLETEPMGMSSGTTESAEESPERS